MKEEHERVRRDPPVKQQTAFATQQHGVKHQSIGLLYLQRGPSSRI
jgi:hypothetical protein